MEIHCLKTTLQISHMPVVTGLLLKRLQGKGLAELLNI